MTQDQKIIRNKLGLLKLAQTLGSVSEACKVLGFGGVRISVCEAVSRIGCWLIFSLSSGPCQAAGGAPVEPMYSWFNLFISRRRARAG